MLTVLRYPTSLPFTSACRVATGRSAIYHMAKQWNPSHVFMPGYAPEGLVNPFVAAGVTVGFYKLDSMLRPNAVDLARQLDAAKADRPIIVLIHYFGQRQPYGACRELADRYDGILFEDLAHCVMSSERGLGADVVLYSLNKFLPVCDGAILASRRDDLNVNATTVGPLPPEILSAYTDHLATNFLISRAPRDRDVSDLLLESEQDYGVYYDFISNDMTVLRDQSAESRAIEAATDFQRMALVRRSKSSILADHLPLSYSVGSESSAEFAFPIRCNGNKENVVMGLAESGIGASALVDKWDHMPGNAGFDIEQQFIDDHLLLPIGVDVKIDDLLAMAEVVKGFV